MSRRRMDDEDFDPNAVDADGLPLVRAAAAAAPAAAAAACRCPAGLSTAQRRRAAVRGCHRLRITRPPACVPRSPEWRMCAARRRSAVHSGVQGGLSFHLALHSPHRRCTTRRRLPSTGATARASWPRAGPTLPPSRVRRLLGWVGLVDVLVGLDSTCPTSLPTRSALAHQPPHPHLLTEADSC